MSDWRQKLDAYSRRAVADGQPDGGLDVTVRLVGGDPSELHQAGFELHTSIGDVVVGHVADRATLERIASLPSVAEIHASQPLYNETA